MEYFYRHYVVTLGILCACAGPTCSHEPLVLSLSHNPNVFRVNTKEYLILGDQTVKIGCGISIPQGGDTSVQLTLQDGDRELNQLASVNGAQLHWSGSPFETSNLSCKVKFTMNGHSSSIVIKGIIIHNVRGGVHCFPGFFESVFLLNEIVSIFCVVSEGGYKWDSGSMDLEFQEDNRVRYRNGLRAFVNYVSLASLQVNSLKCTHDNNAKDTCSVGNIILEYSLSISILPATFSSNISTGFRCVTNLATEYISWYIELIGNENMIRIEPWSEIPWQFMVTHHRNVSDLVFINSSVTGLKSVSCSTSRAGYLVYANTYNETFDTSIIDRPRPATGFVVTAIFLSLVCTTLGAVTFLLTYKIKRLGGKTTNVTTKGNTTVVMSAKTSEDPYYYATSADFGTIATTGEGKSLHCTTTMRHGKDNEGLSMDILDNESVVVTNSAYEIS